MSKLIEMAKKEINETKPKAAVKEEVKIEIKPEEAKPNEKKEDVKSLKNSTITELIGLKDAAITLVNFYNQEYKMLEPYTDTDSQIKKTEYMRKNQLYNSSLILILNELEKRINEICH